MKFLIVILLILAGCSEPVEQTECDAVSDCIENQLCISNGIEADHPWCNDFIADWIDCAVEHGCDSAECGCHEFNWKMFCSPKQNFE